MTRAGLYLRVSTDDQARDGYGLPDQERRGREVAAREKWTVTVYRDDGRSGADRDRPDLARMMADVQAGNLDVVWFATQDRLTRDVAHTAELFASFIAAGIDVWEGHGPVDLGDDGQTRVDLNAVFAAWERRKIASRTRAGIAERTRSGRPWGEPPYGYRVGPDGTHEPHPDEAPIRERIIRLHVEGGMAFSTIARTLNHDGVPTRRGTRWTPNVVRRIIERADDATAQRLAEQRATYAAGGHAGRLPRHHLFVRGALRCGLCDAAMLPRAHPRGGRDFYICRTRRMDSACAMPVLPRDAVDMAALTMFERNALDLDATRAMVATSMGARATEARAECRRAEREAAELAAQIDRIEADYLSGELGAASYERLSARLAESLTASVAERDRLAAHADRITAMLDGLDAESETLRRLAELRAHVAGRVTDVQHDVGALRAAWAAVFDNSYIVPGQAFTGPDGPPDLLAMIDPNENPHDALFLVPIVRQGLLADLLTGPADDHPDTVTRVPLAVAQNWTGTSVPVQLFGPVRVIA